MKTLLENAVESRLSEVCEARTKLRDAIQRSDLADVTYWEDHLIGDLASLREWQERLDWETKATGGAK